MCTIHDPWSLFEVHCHSYPPKSKLIPPVKKGCYLRIHRILKLQWSSPGQKPTAIPACSFFFFSLSLSPLLLPVLRLFLILPPNPTLCPPNPTPCSQTEPTVYWYFSTCSWPLVVSSPSCLLPNRSLQNSKPTTNHLVLSFKSYPVFPKDPMALFAPFGK